MATSAYTNFLSAPTPAHLAENATLTYTTTTTFLQSAPAILKHLHAQLKQVVLKSSKVLHSIESSDSLCLETETSILFKSGGGAYLPGLDDNLLDERLVTFPITHIVRFDGQQKIVSIRMSWDQATLLKQVEAIGRSGRNWPIRDGSSQVDAIVKSVKSSGSQQSSQALPTRSANDVKISSHKKNESVTATRDPHASLALFNPRDSNAEDAESRSYNGPAPEATRQSARPPPREYSELFAGDDAASIRTARSPSPTKGEFQAKSGAGKHHVDNRLFDRNSGDENQAPQSPEKKKTYGNKYDHFSFGDDGEDAPKGNQTRKLKAAPVFNFQDSETPAKVEGKTRQDFDRHWGDESTPASQPKRPIVHAARPDSEAQFRMTDTSSPADKGGRSAFQRQKGMGLYRDPMYEDGNIPSSQKSAGNSNGNSAHHNIRRDDEFGPHFTTAASTSPPQHENEQTSNHYNENDHASAGVKAKRSEMESHWGFESPSAKEKLSENDRKIYKTAGDGMGSRKGARGWGIGDESGGEEEVEEARMRGRVGKQGRVGGAREGGHDFYGAS